MTFGVNTSPFMGKEATHSTSRMLHERLINELRTNVSLRVDTTDASDVFLVSGRGELHLSILVETMRREGYEFQVSRPEPVTKLIDGKVHEPYEHLAISTSEDFVGALTEYLSGRLAQLLDMKYDGAGNGVNGVPDSNPGPDRLLFLFPANDPGYRDQEQRIHRVRADEGRGEVGCNRGAGGP